MKERYQIELDSKKAFQNGYNVGLADKERVVLRNKALKTVLMELIGYEKDWLTSEAGYKKYNNKELIQIILEQREVMKLVFEKLDDNEKENLRSKIEKDIW